jgi:N-acetylglucosamine malate deacetylase 2
MKIMYIFPHPDDESFGPALGMSAQMRAGHEIFLLTTTKGGATKQRHKLGLSVEEMGEVRYKEMLEVEKVLGLAGMTVLDMPDSGMKEMDPREIERQIRAEIERIKPDILVTYPVHGISGFHDHLVIHGVMKRLYLQMKDEGANYLKRLAFFTLNEEAAKKTNEKNIFTISSSPDELIDCAMPITDEDKQKMKDSLMCYKTYQETIANTGIMDMQGDKAFYEFYMEDFNPPLDDITKELK